MLIELSIILSGFQIAQARHVHLMEYELGGPLAG